MVGTITTGNLSRLMQKGVHKTYGHTYASFPKQWSKFLDEKTSEKNFEVDVQVEGLSLAGIKNEGADVDYDSFTQGFTPKYPSVTYAKGVIFTEEVLEDELYGVIKDRTKMLARSMNQTEETVGANVLNNGFDTAVLMTDGDGLPLFSTAHVKGPSGGTYSNKLTVDADLTETSLEDLIIQIGQATDPRGNNIALMAKVLIVPVKEQYNAHRILGSVLQNDTANNATNAVRDLNGLTFSVNNYLTDVNAWFVKTDAPQGLTRFTRRAVRFGEDQSFGSGNLRFKTDSRFAVGWTDPLGAFGSSGS